MIEVFSYSIEFFNPQNWILYSVYGPSPNGYKYKYGLLWNGRPEVTEELVHEQIFDDRHYQLALCFLLVDARFRSLTVYPYSGSSNLSVEEFLKLMQIKNESGKYHHYILCGDARPEGYKQETMWILPNVFTELFNPTRWVIYKMSQDFSKMFFNDTKPSFVAIWGITGNTEFGFIPRHELIGFKKSDLGFAIKAALTSWFYSRKVFTKFASVIKMDHMKEAFDNSVENIGLPFISGIHIDTEDIAKYFASASIKRSLRPGKKQRVIVDFPHSL